MSKYQLLESVRSEIDKCVKCAACQFQCPTYESSYSETQNARGKIRLAQGAMEGKLELSPRLSYEFFHCLSCLNCADVCPPSVDTLKIFSAMRAEIVAEKGMGALEKIFYKQILPYPNRLNIIAKLAGLGGAIYLHAPDFLSRYFPYTGSGSRKGLPQFMGRNLRSILPQVSPAVGASDGKKGRAVYFSGCMTDLAFQETGVKVVEQLNAMGMEVLFPKDQLCCGAPAYFAGDFETARRIAIRNTQVLSEVEADAIVYSCGTCGSVLNHAYRQLLPEHDGVKTNAGKLREFSQLMAESQATQKNIKGKKLRVTYHDPCHLRRGMGVNVEPREILKGLPQVEYVEMENADSCCGGAGTFTLSYYEDAKQYGQAKAGAIIASGADIVATACPSCQIQLVDALKQSDSNIRVMSVAEVVGLSIPRDG